MYGKRKKKNLLLIKTLILQMSLRCTFVVPPQVRYLSQSTSLPLSSPFRMRRTQQTLPDLTRFNLVISPLSFCDRKE